MITPEGITLGLLTISWSGLITALGIGAGALLVIFEAKRRGDDPEIVYVIFLPLVFWGTIGARLWHILTPSLSAVEAGLTASYYLSSPLDILFFWIGGYGLPGAWIGGFLVLMYITKRDNLPFWSLMDLLAPGFALAQAIGRIGNYINQELYGLPTNLLWKIYIEPTYRLTRFETIEYYHPLFFYEAALNLINAVLLLWLARRFTGHLRAGDLFSIYLAFYSAARFLLEFLRLDISLAYGFNINQVFFLFTFSLAIARLWKQHSSAPRHDFQ